jgi:hypothetical protein
VQAHGIGRCLVEDYDDVIEAHRLMKPAGQFLKQPLQIAMRDNCLRDGKQGAVALAAGLCLRITLKPCHGECRERRLMKVALLLFAVA